MDLRVLNGSVLRFNVRHDLAELAKLRRIAIPFLQRRGVSARNITRAHLVLEEALSNVMRHAPGVDGIDVQIVSTDGAVEVLIEDDGPAFDPLQAAEPDLSGPLESRPTSGMGIHFMRQVAQQLRYERVEARNRLSVLLGADAT